PDTILPRMPSVAPKETDPCSLRSRQPGYTPSPTRCPERAVPPENRPVPQKVYRRPVMRRRNPRNGAAIFAVPRLNLLCSSVSFRQRLMRLGRPISAHAPEKNPFSFSYAYAERMEHPMTLAVNARREVGRSEL